MFCPVPAMPGGPWHYPETNSKFTPENGWLEDFLLSLWAGKSATNKNKVPFLCFPGAWKTFSFSFGANGPKFGWSRSKPSPVSWEGFRISIVSEFTSSSNQNASLAETPRKPTWQWKHNHLKMYLPLKRWGFSIVMLIFGGCDFPQFKSEHSQVMVCFPPVPQLFPFLTAPTVHTLLSSKKLYTLHIRRFRRDVLSFHYCPRIFDLYHQTAPLNVTSFLRDRMAGWNLFCLQLRILYCPTQPET